MNTITRFKIDSVIYLSMMHKNTETCRILVQTAMIGCFKIDLCIKNLNCYKIDLFI